MAVASVADTAAEAYADAPRAHDEGEIDRTAAGADAGSLAGGMVMVTPFVPLGAAVVLLFLYLIGLALEPSAAAVDPSTAGAPFIQATQAVLEPLRLIAREAPVTLAIFLTAIGWVVSALFLRGCHLTSPRFANGSVFDEVMQRYVSLEARVRALKPYVPDRPFERAAYEEARGLCRRLRDELTRGGPGWAIGTSYVNAWRLVHRTEEALMAVQPPEDIVADAASDELRLRDSSMHNEAYLMHQLAVGVKAFDPAARRYLSLDDATRAGATGGRDGAATGQPAAGHEPVPGALAGANGSRDEAGVATTATAIGPGVNVVTTVQLEGSDDLTPGADPRLRERQAAAVIRSVRRSINDFRDSRRDELVRLRNHLRATTTLTNVATFVILAVAVRALITDDGARRHGPLHDPIVAATAFYFVGALVGLIDQLYRESQTQSATEDYGLFDARLTLTPVLSGLSAVGGVLLGAMLLGTVGTSAVIPGEVPALAAPATSTPVAAPTAAAGPASSQSATEPRPAQGAASEASRSPGRLALADIFSLGAYGFGLVVAAIFGLTPRLFFDRLRTESNAYVKALEATSSGQSRPMVGGQPATVVSAQASVNSAG